MRVIEPHQFKQLKPRRKKSRRRTTLLLAVFLLAAAGAYTWKSSNLPEDKSSNSTQSETVKPPIDNSEEPKKSGKLKKFTSQEFYDLYHSFAYPNTRLISEPPEITGNTATDNRIRALAEKRGYELKSVPVAPIFKIDEPGLDGEDDLLQEKALASWKELKKAAVASNISLRLNSGYRSVNLQREFFLNALRSNGITTNQIAGGQADTALNGLLRTTAVPGYSRHHTGYTVDFVCGNGATAFEFTPCFTWLSKNNYEQAKKAGWIPSYPEGIKNQGPDPEPWEYVWVGTDAVMD